jgi:hypothetical protein
LTITKNQGATQMQLAEISLNTEAPGASKPVTNYRRWLDLASATAGVEFTRDGVRERRELFASHPAGLIVMRWTADRPGFYLSKGHSATA